MSATELCWLTGTEIRDGLSRGAFTCAELTGALLDRIAALNPRLEAYVTVTAERALDEARERDAERARGRVRGPLHGVPFSLKDIIATKGVRTTAGSTLLADWIPEEDATVVERLAAAGAVLLGKTNSHEFAYGITTQTIHGRTRNPWDPARLPGGSSGGSAAAVAAGLGPFSLGSDTGGSIRLPAAWTGVAGLKPTYGRVSCHGVVAQSFTADHVGPMARAVADLALVLQVIAGPDPRDPEARREPAPDALAAFDGGGAGLRIGIPRELFAIGLEPGVASAFDDAGRVLRDLGCDVREVSIPLLARAGEINRAVIMAETTARHDEWAEGWFAGREITYGADVAEWLDLGCRITAPEFVRAERQRRQLRAEIAEALSSEVDLLLVPATPCAAPPLGASAVRLGGREVGLLEAAIHFLCPFSLTGLPALALPAGFDRTGLPVGIQLVGRALDEVTVLRAGHAFDEATGCLGHHPPYP